MANYILRDVDARIWERFKAKCDKDGRPMRFVIIRLIELWLKGDITL